MTDIIIDMADVGHKSQPGDRVTISAPAVRASSDGDRVIHPRGMSVELVEGKGTIPNVDPGPLRLQIIPAAGWGYGGGPGTFQVNVPDQKSITLRDLLEEAYEYTPPVVNHALDTIRAERDDVLSEMVITVQQEVEGELGNVVRTTQAAAISAEQAAVRADGRATSAETKVNTYTPRVVALEALGGLSSQSPVDGQTANLIEQSATLTREALNRGYTKRGEIVRNVVDYGARPNSYLDDTAAIQAAINAGGTTYFPPGTYIAKGLVPPQLGMRLQGAKRSGQGFSRLRTVDGHLFNTDGVNVHSAHFSDMTFDSFREGEKTGGSILTGSWNLSTFRFCSFTQYNDNSPAFEITGWIDNLMTECSITHTTTATVPTFRAISSRGDLAQSVFQSCRFNNSGNYSVHLEGTQGSIPINFTFRDVNFEAPVGGAIRLLSCRNVIIDNCGLWDFWEVGAKRHQISVGRSSSAGAESRNISIRNLIRDASLPPQNEVYDIFVYPSTSRDIHVADCRHQLDEPFKVSMGSAVGTLSGGGMTVYNAMRCTRLTGGWEAYSPQLLGEGSAIGNGSIAGSYTRVGNTIHFEVSIILGSTSTISSLARVSLPTLSRTTRSYSSISGAAIQIDKPYRQLAGIVANNRDAIVLRHTVNGELLPLTATSLVTWAAGNGIEIRGTYEAEA